jgi:hypothetical protein
MDEPTAAECRKCGTEFMTRASTRTRCPGCKMPVTVKRGGSESRRASAYAGQGEDPPILGVASVLVMGAIVCVVLLWGWLKGKPEGPAFKPPDAR